MTTDSRGRAIGMSAGSAYTLSLDETHEMNCSTMPLHVRSTFLMGLNRWLFKGSDEIYNPNGNPTGGMTRSK